MLSILGRLIDVRNWETFGRPGGTVGRPCHNKTCHNKQKTSELFRVLPCIRWTKPPAPLSRCFAHFAVPSDKKRGESYGISAFCSIRGEKPL